MSRSPEERLAQWDRTVRVFGLDPDFKEPWDRWWLGEIVQNTRLFLAGDHVIVSCSNGGGERQPVYAVSGKGVHVKRLYLQYKTQNYRRSARVPLSRYDWYRGPSGGLTSDLYEHDHGPLRFVELPDLLTEDGLAVVQPADPGVRRFVEARVRAVPVVAG